MSGFQVRFHHKHRIPNGGAIFTFQVINIEKKTAIFHIAGYFPSQHMDHEAEDEAKMAVRNYSRLDPSQQTNWFQNRNWGKAEASNQINRSKLIKEKKNVQTQ